jgi:hypothetical protein
MCVYLPIAWYMDWTKSKTFPVPTSNSKDVVKSPYLVALISQGRLLGFARQKPLKNNDSCSGNRGSDSLFDPL